MEKQWYFNTVTEQPELGMVSPASHRMGPYKTREDALDAWKIVQERNLKWEEQDREWKRWSEDPLTTGPIRSDPIRPVLPRSA